MLKKFGAFFIGIGIAVTGVLWHERRDGVIRGEDMAAVIHQVMDVYLIGKLMGDATPDYWDDGGYFDAFGSNLVKGAVIRMEDLRKAALRAEQLPQWSNPVWIDPACSEMIKDGATILTFTNKPVLVVETNLFHAGLGEYIEYEVRGYHDYTQTAPVSHVRTLSSRAYNGVMPFERGVSLTNDPICRWVDGNAVMAWDYDPWPSGSLWATNMGAKAYTMRYRTNFTSDDYHALVRPYFIQGMNLSTISNGVHATVPSVRLKFPAGQDGSPGRAEVRTAYYPATVQMCAIVDVTAADGSTCSFAAAGGFTGAQLAPPSGGWAVALEPGPNTIEVWRDLPLPANGVLRAEAVRSPGLYMATGCNVYTNDTGRYEISIHMNAGEDETHADLVKLWLDVPGITPVYSYVAVGPKASPMAGYPVRLGGFVTPVVNGVAGVDVYPQIPGDKVTTVYDRVIAQRNLDAVRAVLTNCTTSAYISSLPFLGGETVMEYYAGSHHADDTGSFASNVSGLFGNLSFSGAYTDSSIPWLGCDVLCDAIFARNDGPYPYTYFYGHLSFNRNVSATFTLRYPSAYAVTNGYVGRIRVFVSYKYSHTVPSSLSSDHLTWDPGLVYSKGFFTNQLPISNLPILSICDETEVDKAGNASGMFHDSYNSSTIFRGITLNQIAEIVSPTTTNDLTFTYTPPYRFPYNPGSDNFLLQHSDPYFGTDEFRGLCYWIQIYPAFYVIVVDWKWPPAQPE
jgi:hypothetical protein